jgi:hypothetical protein
MRLYVETYSGYKADERPIAFCLGTWRYEVAEILDQWYDPAAIYFRIRASDGCYYVIRHDQDPMNDVWTLEAFRKATRSSDR